MRRAFLIFLLIYPGLYSSAIVRCFSQERDRIETEHLIITWKVDTTSDEIEAAKEKGEGFYSAIRKLLGHEPKSKIVILMQGPAEQADGSWGYPRVDSWGRIHLFRFGPTLESYFSALAHEMVHVFRFSRRANADWFFEEGFAEFVALRVDPPLRGFPWYDSPIVVAAGQWIANGEDIPLAILREMHRALNLPCKAQSYTLRSSFFDYLGKRYGNDAVLRMARQEHAGALSDYRTFFKKNFDELDLEWRKALLTEYNNTADVNALARRYRQETPIQYMPVCKQGEQF